MRGKTFEMSEKLTLLLFIFTLLYGCIVSVSGQMVFNDGDVEEVDLEGNVDLVEDDDGVLILTTDNFKRIVYKRTFVLVEFYAPWCVHCKQLAPEYAAAAKELKDWNDITLGKVDATKEGELAKKHMVTGFPTLILFKNGVKLEEYNGDRTKEGIVQYLKARTSPDWKPPPTHVLELGSDNFTKILEKKPLALVMFYAPYCSHCQQMKPEYVNAANKLREYNIPLMQVDGTVATDIADEFKVKGWPTLFVFRHGRAFEYKGTRDEKGIISYMQEQRKPPSTRCTSKLEVQNRIERYLPTVIGVFESKNSPFAKEFMAVANYLRNEPLKFVHTYDANTGRSLIGETREEKEAIIVRKAPVFVSEYEKPGTVFYNNKASGDDIAEFIRANYKPLVGQRTKQNQVFFYSTRPLVVVYYDVNFDHQYQKQSEITRAKVLDVAHEFPDINFAVANEDEYEEELKAVKLDDSGVDVNVVWYHKDRIKYKMEPVDDFHSSDLRTFIHQVKDDVLKPVWKSLPIPKQQKGPVTTVVADNFMDEVLDSKHERDTMFYIYAPWCGHCKKFDSTFTSLAKKLSSDRLKFVKMDGASNDLPPGFEIKGYPSLFFIPAYKKHEPSLYEGDRTFQEIKKFIDKESTIFLTQEEREGRNKVEL